MFLEDPKSQTHLRIVYIHLVVELDSQQDSMALSLMELQPSNKLLK